MIPKIIAYNEDCITGMAEKVADNSVHLTVTSIPFEELFTYSGKLEDVGNNGSTVNIREGRFALNMRFVIEQLFRVTAPGYNVCIHIQQLLAYKNQHGFIGRRDFRGAIIDLFSSFRKNADNEKQQGFNFFGEIVIAKNPQAIAQRLKLNSLLFETAKTNAQNLAPVFNDYILIFKKPGEAKVPVRAMFDKKKNPTGWLTSEEWIRDACGVWKDIRETDVLDGYRSARESDEEKHVCVARDSLVLTRKGYVPIQDVQVDDLVFTHLGRWRKVLAKKCNGIRKTVQLGAQGVPFLRVTPDHLIWTRKGVGKNKGVSKPRQTAQYSNPEWINAENTKGSYVNLKLPMIEESPYTPEEWWIVGRWLGDGHLDTRGRVHISCSHREKDELVKKLGARAGAVTLRRTVYQIAVNDRDGRIREILKNCGQCAAGKTLPAEALELDIERSEALLSGYLSADGHFNKQYQRWMASSVSRALLLGIAMIAQRGRGVSASVYAGRPAGETQIEGRTVKTKQDWILSIPPQNLSSFIAEDGAWKKVRKLNASEEIEVWDLQVEEDESFTVEGCIVHNCPLQLDVVRRLVRLYSNPISIQPDSTVLDPFGGIGTTPYIAVEQDRNAISFELKESYFSQNQRNTELAFTLRKQAQNNLFAEAAV